MSKIIRAALFVLLTSGSAANAACGLSIVANDLGLDWELSWTMHAISISITKTNPAACTVGLGFSKGSANSYTRSAANGSVRLPYQVYQDSGMNHILKDVPDVSSANDVVWVNMPVGGGMQTVIYYFDIPFSTATTPSLIAAGTYSDSFIINAYEGPDAASLAAPPAASAQVNVSIAVSKMVALSLVDTGGVFQDSATTKSVDFGTLVTGAVSRFDLRLRTNAGYSITFASANNGRMKHLTKNSYVPYSIYLNNAVVDTSGATPVAGSGQSPLAGLGFPVKIVVGTMGNLPIAGKYQDTVTITATATE